MVEQDDDGGSAFRGRYVHRDNGGNEQLISLPYKHDSPLKKSCRALLQKLIELPLTPICENPDCEQALAPMLDLLPSLGQKMV